MDFTSPNTGILASQSTRTDIIEGYLLQLESKRLSIRQKAARELRVFSDNKSNQDAIREAGGIASLVRLLRDEDDSVRRNAVRVLCHLTAPQNPATQDAIRAAGGVNELKRNIGHDDATAVLELGHLHLCSEEIYKYEGIELLVPLIQDNDAMVARNAVRVLSNLTANYPGQYLGSIESSNGIMRLVEVLQNNDDSEVKIKAAGIINAIMHLGVNEDEIFYLPIHIEPLMNVVWSSDVHVKQQIIEALYLVVTKINDACWFKLRDKLGGIEFCTKLLGEDDSIVRQHAIALLASLLGFSISTPASDKIRTSGGIDFFVKLLADSDPRVKEHTAICVETALYSNDTNRDAFREAGGIAPLVRLLEDRDVDVRTRASWAVLRLAYGDSSTALAIQEAGGVALLVRLLRDDNVALKRNAAGALSNLAISNPACKDAIREAGGITSLVKLIEDQDTILRTRAVDALVNLSTNHAANQEAIAKSGALDILEPLSRVAESAEIQAMARKICDACQWAVEAARPAENPVTSIPIIKSTALTINYTRKLGEGSFGVVYEAGWLKKTVAVKKLRAGHLSDDVLASFQEEAQRHGILRHPNILSLYGVCVEPGEYCIVIALMTKGSLDRLLHSTEALPWTLRLSIAINITEGLYYLHENSIIHCDLKSLNVLLDDHHNACLADFGLSKIKTESNLIGSSVPQARGTTCWMAPELFEYGSRSTVLSDIYALGMVLWELASRKYPFEDETQANDATIIHWVTSSAREKIPEGTPVGYAKLLTDCWAQRQEDRPTSAGVVADRLSAMTSSDAARVAHASTNSGYAYLS